MDRRLTPIADRRQHPAPDRRDRPTADRRSGRDRRLARARVLALVAGAWLAMRIFVVQAFDIPSGSMSNTLLAGDVMFVTKGVFGAGIPWTSRHLPALREPRSGEILIFHSVEGTFDMVKRVAGLPGDTLSMMGGRLVRNGEAVAEPYAVHGDSLRSESAAARKLMRAWQLPHYVGPDADTYAPDVQHWGPIVVPPGSLFMMGDNRDDSRDSRYWGFLPRGNVVGSPLVVYYSHDPAQPLFSAIRWDRLFAIPQ